MWRKMKIDYFLFFPPFFYLLSGLEIALLTITYSMLHNVIVGWLQENEGYNISVHQQNTRTPDHQLGDSFRNVNKSTFQNT